MPSAACVTRVHHSSLVLVFGYVFGYVFVYVCVFVLALLGDAAPLRLMFGLVLYPCEGKE